MYVKSKSCVDFSNLILKTYVKKKEVIVMN